MRDPATGREGRTVDLIRPSEGEARAEYCSRDTLYMPEARIEVRTNDSTMAPVYATVQIIPTDLEIILDKNPIGFDDSTELRAVMRNADGSRSPIPSEWFTHFEIVDADTIAFFSVPNGAYEGSYIRGNVPGIKVHSNSLVSPPDSAEVTITVESENEEEGGGGPALSIRKLGSELKTKEKRIEAALSHKNAGENSKMAVMLGKTATRPRTELSSAAEDDPSPYHYGVARLVVKNGDRLDHFKVTIEKPEIGFGESSKIFVQAKDAADNDVNYDPDSPLAFCVESNADYGTFIDSNNDTVWTQPALLNLVKYGDAQAGKIRLAAVFDNPTDPISIKIKVYAQAQSSAQGEKQATVVPQTLKIVIVGPKDVWPLMLPFTPKNHHTDNTTVLEVQMTRNGQPVSEHPILLTTEYVNGSGGHDHLNTRRPMTLDYMGSYISTQTGEQANPMNDKTTSYGKAYYGYVSSFLGDRMKMKLQSTQYPLLWDTTSVIERVPDLELLPGRPYYTLIGGTDKHHGPRADNLYPNSRTPDNNHWGAHSTIVALDSIAANYHAFFPNDDLLGFNDISLPLGGRFDIDGKWVGTGRHEYHRLGRDIDVRRPTIPDENERGFEQLCRKFGVIEPDPEDESHYHLYFWDRTL